MVNWAYNGALRITYLITYLHVVDQVLRLMINQLFYIKRKRSGTYWIFRHVF